MNRDESPGRYSDISIALHWLMLLLFVAVYATIELRELYPRGSDPREALKGWHFTLGLTVMHLALYALMIAMPLAGWLILSAEGDPVPFFGLRVPALAGPDAALAERVETLHELGGTIGYWLIGLHAAASLFHQYVLKDRLMARMRPLRA